MARQLQVSFAAVAVPRSRSDTVFRPTARMIFTPVLTFKEPTVVGEGMPAFEAELLINNRTERHCFTLAELLPVAQF
jgi:hypothetical protein